MTDPTKNREAPLVEVVLRNENPPAPPTGKVLKATAFGLFGAVLFAIAASAFGAFVLPWYHGPDIEKGVELAPNVIEVMAEQVAHESVQGLLMVQGGAALAGFALFFMIGLFRFGRAA